MVFWGSEGAKIPWCFGWFFLGIYLNTKEKKIRVASVTTRTLHVIIVRDEFPRTWAFRHLENPNMRSFKGQHDKGQQDREPLRGQSASERVSEREDFERFLEVFKGFQRFLEGF